MKYKHLIYYFMIKIKIFNSLKNKKYNKKVTYT